VLEGRARSVEKMKSERKQTNLISEREGGKRRSRGPGSWPRESEAPPPTSYPRMYLQLTGWQQRSEKRQEPPLPSRAAPHRTDDKTRIRGAQTGARSERRGGLAAPCGIRERSEQRGRRRGEHEGRKVPSAALVSAPTSLGAANARSSSRSALRSGARRIAPITPARGSAIGNTRPASRAREAMLSERVREEWTEATRPTRWRRRGVWDWQASSRGRNKMWALGWSMAGGTAIKAPWTAARACAPLLRHVDVSCSCLPPFFLRFPA
jgi:hypothetical protein